ncbi:hypothetical protein ACLI4Q_09615 [Natrialbaceae archaeon A-CW1-1]
MTDSETARAIERQLHREHDATLSAVNACADAVAADWSTSTVSDRQAVVDPLRTRLESSGVLESLPGVLIDLADAAGYTLPPPPVAGPPYVVVTSRGPMLRATIDPGRLVVRFDVFDLEREQNPVYRRLEEVDVSVRVR